MNDQRDLGAKARGAWLRRVAGILAMALALVLLAGTPAPLARAGDARGRDGQPHTGQPGWQDQIVDLGGDVGYRPALALDGQGHPHVAYYDNTWRALKYAYWDGVIWHTSTVEGDLAPTWVSSFQCALVLDSGDVPHIVYEKQIASNPNYLKVLRYAVGVPGNWQITTVPPGSLYPIAYAPSLALDSLGDAHVSYSFHDALYNSYQHTLRYASLTIDGWQTQTVYTPTYGLSAWHSDLALDAAGQPRIAFGGGDEAPPSQQEPLYYMAWSGTAWQVQMVDASAREPSLALDSLGRPHIAYGFHDPQNPNEPLIYAHWDGNAWQFETLLACCRYLVSLALDVYDYPHILMSAGLHLFSWDGVAWHHEIIDTGYQGGQADLALEGLGDARIAYFDPGLTNDPPDPPDVGYNDLHYLAWAPAWSLEPIEANGIEPSLAVDLQGRPYTGYYDAGYLHLAHWDDSWQLENVVAHGGYNSVQLTYDTLHQALPQFSYLDSAPRYDLEHAKWNGTAWVTETVDSPGQVGWYTSLAIDSFGHSHIGYWDFTTYHIKYAEHDGLAWHVRTNTAGPPLDPFSAFYSLSLGVTRAGAQACCRTYIAYLDGGYGDLRLATWDGTQWTDELVDSGGSAFVGLWAALGVDWTSGEPAVAYYDQTNQRVKYATRASGVWTIQLVDDLPSEVNDLALDLAASSVAYPRIAYTVNGDHSVRLASRTPAQAWLIETVDLPGSPPVEIALSMRDRERMVYNGFAQLQYAFRNATLPLPLYYNPLQPCTEDAWPPPPRGPATPRPPFTLRHFAPQTLGDADTLDVLRALRDLFATTPDGQHVIDLYYQYAPETGAIGLADPGLLWDAYLTLQNYVPGAAALVSGSGNQVVITQEMVDQANDVLDRLAAAGSPGLATAIDQERGRYDHLQAFVDGTFDDAALLIGVPLPHSVFLPVVYRSTP